MSRFFIPPECIQDNFASISGEEAHHILNVLRLKRGDLIQAFDGQGRLYQGRIIDTKNNYLRVEIEQIFNALPKTKLAVALMQALPKKDKMDYIIQKCTELGVDVIFPLYTSRTVVRLDKHKANLRKVRWQRLAQETAKQCGRATIPQIEDLISWPKAVSILPDFDLKLLFSLSENRQTLKDVLRAAQKVKKVALLIGPEGDFAPCEVRQACAAGCLSVSLGENVLKCDTAAVSALAMVNYELKN